ncbi:DMT family transporter [Aromatoleum diolicum]|uniref:EamA family transporter n=1 Tax=Aromatoleum diolicum TaxID=75796 RepID=A0ABX1QEX4_9RHOO|nr:DMT family transporter [Aromatoleum diolicum]NMG76984.1 EamA family transporter [Aromatoleum diolicum]
MQSLWMIVASLLFACMGVCVKLGAGTFSTGELVFYRGLVGLFIVALIARIHGLSLYTPHWRLQLTRALAGSTALICYFYAIASLPLATAVTLNYTSPIFVTLLLALWFRERLRGPVLASVALGFVGVILLLKPTLQANQWLGACAGLSSGLVASIAYINVRELGRAGEPEARTVLWFSAVTTVLGIPWALSGDLQTIDLPGGAALAGVGLFGALAQLAMTRAYRFGKTIVAAHLAYTTVIFSSLFGMLLWDEVLPLGAWIAIVLIIASGAAVSLASRQPPQPVPGATATEGGRHD